MNIKTLTFQFQSFITITINITSDNTIMNSKVLIAFLCVGLDEELDYKQGRVMLYTLGIYIDIDTDTDTDIGITAKNSY